MNFEESDINFNRIDWRQFEELCFEMLMKYQYHDLIWHQGSADGGRDIEGLSTVVNPLLGAYTEKWFFECKFYTGGVPMDELVSKIGWATAHRVKHFVLITNTHPTKDTWDYLNKIQETSNFKIHVINGKMIKLRLLAFPDLIVKYFADDTVVWVKNLVRQWLFQKALPEVKTLARLAEVVDPTKLAKEELVFLMMAYESIDYDENDLPIDLDPFDFDFLWPEIIKHQNENYPVNLKDVFLSPDRDWLHLRSISSTIEQLDEFAFAMQHEIDEIGNIQITVRRTGKQFAVKIAIKKTEP